MWIKMKPAYTNAIFFNKMPMSPDYSPDSNPPRRLASNHVNLNMDLVNYISKNHNVGIMIIHMNSHIPSANKKINGKSSIRHMIDVLNISKEKQCEIAILHQHMPAVIEELGSVIKDYPFITYIHQPRSHMGGNSVLYQNFAKKHRSIVVMGFDANICVFANIFGCPEKQPQSNYYTPPLLSMCSVVTSRAVLISDGPIYPVNQQGEWGPLLSL